MNMVVADDQCREKKIHSFYVFQTGVPGFLASMEKACESYEEYLQKKGTK